MTLTLTTERGATGAAIFRGKTAAGSTTELLWLGPRSGLKLIVGQLLVSVEHRTADGQYETLREARAAAAAFIGSIEQPGDECLRSNADMHWCVSHGADYGDGEYACEGAKRRAAVDELNERSRAHRAEQERIHGSDEPMATREELRARW
jgi:hypothetical protein